MYRATIVKALLRGRRHYLADLCLCIFTQAPAGQRCTHRPHRWEEEREAAVAGGDTMKTSTVRFFCLGKRKESWAPSSLEAQRVLYAERTLHGLEAPPGQQLEAAPCSLQERERTKLTSCCWCSSMLLSWGDHRSKELAMAPKPFGDLSEYNISAWGRRKKGNATQHPRDVTPT